MADLLTIRKRLNACLTEYKLATLRQEQARTALIRAEDALTHTEAARVVIQDVSQALQQQAHTRIAAVVTKCLAAIFDEPYQFLIAFDRKRGKTEAVLKLKRGELILDEPLNEAGGGVIDVAAFALRLAALTLQRPRLRRLLVMDEPFKCIRGKRYRERVRHLLQALAAEFGMQFVICVDHEAYPQFMLGKVIEIG